jgi:hypothetical protein
MESGMKSNRLICGPEIAIELLKLTAQSGEAPCHRSRIANLVARAEKAVEGGFDQRRFCGAWMFGRFGQPCGHSLGEINANSGFHGASRLG